MASNKVPQPAPRQHSRQAEAIMFMKDHMSLKAIMQMTRDRFAEIDTLLRQEKINKHDQGHQLRTAANAVEAMRDLGFGHRDTVLAAAGALIHDIGYNQPDEPSEADLNHEYHGGKKAQFKKHALTGAIEAQQALSDMLNSVKQDGEENSDLTELMSYKDEAGKRHVINEEDIHKITEAILNHNDYGKDDDNYDPRQIGSGALMVQLFDKLDICKQRVYPEHMEPGVFVEGHEDFDPKYFHRAVPYCISNYEYKIDEQAGIMYMVYHVELDEFRTLVQAQFPDFQYSETDFVSDFQKAYGKNCSIGAEAIGAIMELRTSAPTLEVELRFKEGSSKKLGFAKPERDIYAESVRPLRASIAEHLAKRSLAA